MATSTTKLMAKRGGNWVSVSKIYKMISGVWVEQSDSDLDTLFDLNASYIKKEISIPTAILYSDGTIIFLEDYYLDTSHGDVVETYIGWDKKTYTSTVSPDWYSNKDLIFNAYIGNVKVKSTVYWFNNCKNLVSVDFNNLDTSNVTDMYGMFCGCSSLTTLDLNNFDTSNVTDMGHMFQYCTSLTTINLNNFDTSNVTNMSTMFYNCHQLTSLDLSNFNTSNVTDMSYMFTSCANLTPDLSNFNTNQVTNMSCMFYNCYKLTTLDLSNFNTSNVTNMSSMFYACNGLESIDLSSFNINQNTNVDNMFKNCTSPNLTIYVEDEATKTIIESSSDFPTTATVVIGSPN